MTNDELNEYIKHYIEKDHTGRAIMLTGEWGTGKSYYIKKSLIPYLKKPENGEHKCVVVSLYGISEISEISKAIYLEARVKRELLKSEAVNATLLSGKTVAKGVASLFGINLSVDEKDLQQLYASIDLTGILVVFEDVERTNIDIIQFLGYVNSMTEQDGVKVLLVANEKELIKYEPIKSTDNTNTKTVVQRAKRPYTSQTEKYLKVKEKTVEDTITFRGDFATAVKEIINTFDHVTLKKFSFDPYITNIIHIMALKKNFNLRSVLFACQKTVDIFERIGNVESIRDDFVQAIFYGIIFFSLTIHETVRVAWRGSDYYSLELGSQEYPLFKFCYDYIVDQRLDVTTIPETITAFDKLTKYNHNKTNPDSDLVMLENYLIHSECEVVAAIHRLESRLQDPSNIAFADYGRIVASLITLKYDLKDTGLNEDICIEQIKRLLVINVEKTEKEIDEDEIIWVALQHNASEAHVEYDAFREEILRKIYEKAGVVPGFNYVPEQADYFKKYVSNNEALFYKKHGFARFLDINSLSEMYSRCSAEQMNNIYLAFYNIYHIANAREFFREDESAIEDLIAGLNQSWERPDVDSIQLLQYKKFIEELESIKVKLS